MKGYLIVNYNGTGMMEVQKDDSMNIFSSDEEAVMQALNDGIKIIPVNELPEDFDRRYFGWIDTQENRRKIKEYCQNRSCIK